MKTPRKIDQPITQVQDTLALLERFEMTLNAAYAEAKLVFQRQLENYEILSYRIRQIKESLPKIAKEVDSFATSGTIRKPRKKRARVILLDNGMDPQPADTGDPSVHETGR